METMFITGKNMFLGTTTGMIIYDISFPLHRHPESIFNHARSCDPVIVDDTLAYVTLRSGTTCGGTVNCLDVVNVKNLSKPVSGYIICNDKSSWIGKRWESSLYLRWQRRTENI